MKSNKIEGKRTEKVSVPEHSEMVMASQSALYKKKGKQDGKGSPTQNVKPVEQKDQADASHPALTNEQLKEEIWKEMDIADFHKEMPTAYFKDMNKAVDLAISKAREGYISQEEYEKEIKSLKLRIERKFLEKVCQTFVGHKVPKGWIEGTEFENVDKLCRYLSEYFRAITEECKKFESLKSAIDALKDKKACGFQIAEGSMKHEHTRKCIWVVLLSDLEALKNG